MFTYISFILLGAIWGYFSDIRKGQYGWFAGRMIFMLIMATLCNLDKYI